MCAYQKTGLVRPFSVHIDQTRVFHMPSGSGDLSVSLIVVNNDERWYIYAACTAGRYQALPVLGFEAPMELHYCTPISAHSLRFNFTLCRPSCPPSQLACCRTGAVAAMVQYRDSSCSRGQGCLRWLPARLPSGRSSPPARARRVQAHQPATARLWPPSPT